MLGIHAGEGEHVELVELVLCPNNDSPSLSRRC